MYIYRNIYIYIVHSLWSKARTKTKTQGTKPSPGHTRAFWDLFLLVCAIVQNQIKYCDTSERHGITDRDSEQMCNARLSTGQEYNLSDGNQSQSQMLC